ncbi:hypothetical protein [Robbsia sp. KACC 23696]|uniref:hypothetical protein n=1 Tax=Robbsia sp. KACC 23696 TaxID=3149231 RepID=UPI00325C24BF
MRKHTSWGASIAWAHRWLGRWTALVVREGNRRFHNSYAAKTGRLNRIEIHIVVPPGWCHRIETHDAIRREVAAELLADARLDAWLSVSFTAEPTWCGKGETRRKPRPNGQF